MIINVNKILWDINLNNYINIKSILNYMINTFIIHIHIYNLNMENDNINNLNL